MAESREKKAHRLLAEGRLIVERVSRSGLVVASCRGLTSGEVYRLGYDPEASEWRCTCKANVDFHRRCSHLIALQLVTVRPPAPS